MSAPNYKAVQRECAGLLKGRVFPPQAMRPGNKLKFNGSDTTYTVGDNGAIVRDSRKLNKAERKYAKRERILSRENCETLEGANAN